MLFVGLDCVLTLPVFYTKVDAQTVPTVYNRKGATKDCLQDHWLGHRAYPSSQLGLNSDNCFGLHYPTSVQRSSLLIYVQRVVGGVLLINN